MNINEYQNYVQQVGNTYSSLQGYYYPYTCPYCCPHCHRPYNMETYYNPYFNGGINGTTYSNSFENQTLPKEQFNGHNQELNDIKEENNGFINI